MNTHNADKDAPPRGRWLHAHLRSCAVQVWFQNDESGDPPGCTCVMTSGEFIEPAHECRHVFPAAVTCGHIDPDGCGCDR